MRVFGLAVVGLLLWCCGVVQAPAQGVETPAFAACRDAADFLINGRGRAFEQIDGPLAIGLCEAALSESEDDPFLLAFLGRALDRGGRHDEALAAVMRSAATGNPVGQTYLGLMYLEVDRSAEAFLLFNRAADQGYAVAEHAIGRMYADGVGVLEDDAVAVGWYRLAADQGHAEAQTNLGFMLLNGLGVAQDREEAVRWYRLAAQQGYAQAQGDLGTLYDYGIGVARDQAEALRWYRLAAEQGDAVSQNNLGVAYASGRGVPVDHAEAVRWYRLAAEQGHAAAQNNLGVMYSNGFGIAEDQIEAVRWYQRSADQGYVEAQHNLGRMYRDGLGVPMDYLEAVRWFRLAAEQGHLRAQFNLGGMYRDGLGVPEDDVEAARWYRLAADRGEASAQVNLGYLYARGEGVARDDVAAVEWFVRAAEQRNATAQFNLGNMYALGRGVIADDAEAVHWYQLAADQGNELAQYNLGYMYASGRGVAQDPATAMYWFHLAAEQGNALAQSTLGYRYSQGVGVEENDVEGVHWYRLAAGHGLASAQVNLGNMYENGDGVAVDYEEAAYWYRQAAEQGDNYGRTALGLLNERTGNYTEAAHWYRLAAETGHPRAQALLSGLYGRGLGVEPDPTEAARLGALAAGQGDAYALANVAWFVNMLAPAIVASTGTFPVNFWIGEELFVADPAVQLDRTLPGQELPETPALATGEIPELGLALPPSEQGWDLTIDINAPGFRIVGGTRRSFRLVPGAEMEPLSFVLQPEPGGAVPLTGRVELTLWYQGGFLATVSREIEITRAPLPTGAAPLEPVRANLAAWFSVEAADLTVRFNFDDPEQLGRATVDVYSPHLTEGLEGEVVIPGDIGEWLTENFQRIVALGRTTRGTLMPNTPAQPADAETLRRMLRGFGCELYRRYAPQAFRSAMEVIRGGGIAIETIQIISNNPIIPFELMVPDCADPASEHLGITYRIARLLTPEDDIATVRAAETLVVEEVAAFAPDYANLPPLLFQDQELAALAAIPGFHQYDGVRMAAFAALDAGVDGIFHFAGHGGVAGQGLAAFEMMFEDGVIDTRTWVGTPTPGETFYFINSCDLAQSDRAYGYLDGWAPVLMRAGARGFVGTLWPVFDQAAADVAEIFYGLLLADGEVQVSEALRMARQRFLETGDPSYLAYAYYGDVTLTIRLPQSP